MKHEYYERKINDVIMKCPIEAGIEILVYNVLDDIVHSKGLVLVDINRLRKKRDKRLTTAGGVPDIAILTNDFEFKSTKGKLYGFVEVKATNKELLETEQVIGQMDNIVHYLYTNGLMWKYYNNKKCIWTICLADVEVVLRKRTECIVILEGEFEKLIDALRKIDWER